MAAETGPEQRWEELLTLYADLMTVSQDDLTLLIRKMRSCKETPNVIDPIGRRTSRLWNKGNPPESIQNDHTAD